MQKVIKGIAIVILAALISGILWPGFRITNLLRGLQVQAKEQKKRILEGNISPERPLPTQHYYQPLGIVWSYGTGVPGSGDGELWTPHMVEDLGEGKLLVTEQTNCAVIIIEKQSRKILWQFGERGVAGTGTRLMSPHSAHRLPGGPYRGNILITEYQGERRVLICDIDTKEIVWEYKSLAGPVDAIYWDDQTIMVSDGPGDKIAKIRLEDKTIVWEYPTVRPFYLQKLVRKGPGQWEYGNSYGGDLLFGRFKAAPSTVTEIDTSNKSVSWEFGGGRFPMLADTLHSGVRAYRYGTGENETASGSAITIIADEGNARILAVNREKQVLWSIGGVSQGFYRPISWLIEPTYVTASKNGNLLICDAMADKLYELVYPPLPPVIHSQNKFSTTVLAVDSVEAKYASTIADCGLSDLCGATSLALTVECTYHSSATTGIAVHLYTSYNGTDFDTEELKDRAGNPIFGDMPFTSGSIQRKTMEIPYSARYIKVTIENKDLIQAVSNIKVTTTIGT